jgi:hypothetical protein
MSKDVSDILRARNFPVRVEYGPERLTRGMQAGSPLILFERDRESGDGVRPAQGAQRNARMKRVRDLGVLVTVFAQSSQDGARSNEHEAFCDSIVDALIVALDEWFQGAKTGALPEYSESKMLPASELEGEYRQWAGCVYRLRFDLPRGVREWTHVAEDTRPRGDLPGAQQPGALPEGTAAGVSNEAHVARAASDEAPEIVEFPGETPP